MFDGFLKEIGDLLVWLFLAPMLWFFKRLVGRVDDVEKEISDHKEEDLKTFVPREEILDHRKEVNDKLDKVIDHLLNKGRD